MKKFKTKPHLTLNLEHLRLITAATGPSPQDLTSQLSQRSSCQGTRFCCRPPFA